ncbi:hypothetical protein T10_10395 [Trichinella papuae]|uniref:Uncharacterized protein n=1 Tax=Trichinella papuae TaxID=268474 RepID=A0A0V1MQL2_9BILA|nr:hypothetical protein T10_10395 [Trichinella papuae]
MICTFETSAHQFERTESFVCGKSARRLRSQLLNDLMKRNEYQDKIIQQLLKSLKENVILCENIVRKDNMTIKEASALAVKNSSSLNDKVEELRDHIVASVNWKMQSLNENSNSLDNINNQAINISQQPPQSPFTAHRKMCENTGCKQSRNRAINTYNKRICSGKSELFKQCNHQKLNKPYSESKNLIKQDVAKIFLRITMINSENIADQMRGGIYVLSIKNV